MWKDVTPTPPKTRLVFEHGRCTFSIGPADGDSGETWQYFSLWCGKHVNRSAEECKESWPREAIAAARAELDALEAKLNEGEDDSRL